jgi:hypothetical protein
MLYKQELWISEQTRQVGRQLLRELNIQMGYGIAEFLAVNQCYDNQQAFLVWLDQQLAKYPEGIEIGQIKQNFYGHFPESYYSLC